MTTAPSFELYPLRFCFVARDTMQFPLGKSGNILRGGFGTVFRRIACVPECPGVEDCGLSAQCAYAQIFEPHLTGAGPSGLADPPRPFVFRAAHLDGSHIAAGERFHFDLHVFEVRHAVVPYFVRAFSQLGSEGLGPARSRADLVNVWLLDASGEPGNQIYHDSAFLNAPALPISLSLAPGPEPVHAVHVEFVTPTELKSGREPVSRPEFPILFARIRDRISTLRALYGSGPLDIDFKSMAERSGRVRMAHCNLRRVEVSRRSSRTGQQHSIGGFAGSADYRGDLTEFVPYLRAACWTGVGRQTVWGKGILQVQTGA